MTIICPYCSKSIHFESYGDLAFKTDLVKGETPGIGVSAGYCPSCEGLMFLYLEGTYHNYEHLNSASIMNPTLTKVLYPFGSKDTKFLSEDVPKLYRGDYEEAAAVIRISTKASAALSRRCLQNFLHNELHIKKKNLALEIEEFIQTQQVPSIVSDALDAIRNIGNFAAHPLKVTNSGEIVDVEDGEAEWLLEVLDLLFDFYFIQPKKLEQRKAALNAKLASLGKQQLK